MTVCSQIHQEYERHVKGEVQLGRLSAWMRVNRDVAVYEFQGLIEDVQKSGPNSCTRSAMSSVKPARLQ